MKILVTFARDERFGFHTPLLNEYKSLAGADSVGKHVIVDNPAHADCILFVDAHLSLDIDYYRLIDRHPLTLKYPEKITVYDEYDRPPCYGRGLYVSMPARLYDKSSHSAVCYWLNKLDNFQVSGTREKLCFFAGSLSHNPTRRRLVSTLAQSYVDLEDTSDYSMWKKGTGEPSVERLNESLLKYVWKLSTYKYCLAPRGQGTSSFRLFEALSMGCVPIVLSNDFVRPEVPNWDEGVLTVNQYKPTDLLSMEKALLQSWECRNDVIGKIYGQAFSRMKRWNFFGDQLENVMNRTSMWLPRGSIGALKTKLYWTQHRIMKRIEGRFV